MADIVAQMSPAVAQHLTVELADKAQQQSNGRRRQRANLPKDSGPADDAIGAATSTRA